MISTCWALALDWVRRCATSVVICIPHRRSRRRTDFYERIAAGMHCGLCYCDGRHGRVHGGGDPSFSRGGRQRLDQCRDRTGDLSGGRRSIADTIVLHDLNLAAQYADRLLLMKQGRIVGEGTPDEVMTEERIGAIFDLRAEVVRDPTCDAPAVFVESPSQGSLSMLETKDTGTFAEHLSEGLGEMT